MSHAGSAPWKPTNRSVIYAKYYILLEKVFKLFTDYEKAYLSKLNSMKDDKIDKLQSTVDEQTSRIDKLLGYAEDTKESLDMSLVKLGTICRISSGAFIADMSTTVILLSLPVLIARCDLLYDGIDCVAVLHSVGM